MVAATVAGAAGLTAAASPARAIALVGIPGIGPPVHIKVLAGEDLTAPPPPTPAAASGLPHNWQKLTGRTAPDLGAGCGALQYGQMIGLILKSEQGVEEDEPLRGRA